MAPPPPAIRFGLNAAAQFVLACTLMLGLAHATIASEVSAAYAVEAAYISKFGLFVAWPKQDTSGPASSIAVCVVGDNPFGDVLEKAVEGQRIGDRPLAVRYVREVARNSGCDILYVSASEGPSAPIILGTVKGTGVLTVTEAAKDAQARGIIDFVMQDNRVRFTIDDQAAAYNGIVISSHLLNLALSVRARN